MDGSLQEELLGGNDAAVSKPGGETTWTAPVVAPQQDGGNPFL